MSLIWMVLFLFFISPLDCIKETKKEEKHHMFMAACKAFMTELNNEFIKLSKEESEYRSGSHMARMVFPVCQRMKDMEIVKNEETGEAKYVLKGANDTEANYPMKFEKDDGYLTRMCTTFFHKYIRKMMDFLEGIYWITGHFAYLEGTDKGPLDSFCRRAEDEYEKWREAHAKLVGHHEEL